MGPGPRRRNDIHRNSQTSYKKKLLGKNNHNSRYSIFRARPRLDTTTENEDLAQPLSGQGLATKRNRKK
jgi:hypothetical protein